MKSSRAGLTVVELLVAAAILVTMLGIVAIYFARQATLTHDAQALSDVQDTARSVMQIASNDLLSAGANRYVPSGATSVTAVQLTDRVPQATPNGVADGVTMEYVSSLRPTLGTACRRVAYEVTGWTTTQGGVLERSDVPCSAASDSYAILADHVLAFDLVYACSDGSMKDAPSQCPSNTYVRSIQIGLMIQSAFSRMAAGPAAPSYSSPTSGTTVTCQSGHACAVLVQEVQTPSLKQYAPGELPTGG